MWLIGVRTLWNLVIQFFVKLAKMRKIEKINFLKIVKMAKIAKIEKIIFLKIVKIAKITIFEIFLSVKFPM